MFANQIHQVYIADGFLDDCEQLIQKCIEKQDIIDFQSFCSIWKEMKLGCLYQGRNTGPEIAELSEEVLQIAKHYMVVNTSNYEESVAGLFLVYSLLNLQPYPGFAALRLVPDDVAAVCRLETVARRDRRYDVLYILASVLIKGPCQYHAVDRERGMEAPLKKYLDGFRNIDSIRGVRPKGVFYRHNVELDIIRDISTVTRNYSAAKAAITGGTSDKGLEFIDNNLPIDLNLSLRKIISGNVDEDDDEQEDQDNDMILSDHHNAIEAIKEKAMKNTVNPMRHLTGIEDRKKNANCQQWRSNSDIKSKPGNIRKNSPTKANTSSPSKRGPSPVSNDSNKKPKTEVVKIKVEDDAESETLQVEWFSRTVDDTRTSDSDDDDSTVNVIDYEIDSIPALIRAEENGDVYEVQIIEHIERREAKTEVINENANAGENSLSLPDLSGISIDTATVQPIKDVSESNLELNKDDVRIFQVPNKRLKRNLKKTHLKSKLKRLGTLSIANMEDKNKK